MDQKNTAEVILNVPYKEKNQAKELGARWDPGIKKWFVPKGRNAEPFRKWFPKESDLTSSIESSR